VGVGVGVGVGVVCAKKKKIVAESVRIVENQWERNRSVDGSFDGDGGVGGVVVELPAKGKGKRKGGVVDHDDHGFDDLDLILDGKLQRLKCFSDHFGMEAQFCFVEVKIE